MLFSRLLSTIKEVIRKVIPYKDIEQVEKVESPLSTEMVNALDLWYEMYLDKAPWLTPTTVHSLNLPSFICSEIARQMVLEFKWNISGTEVDKNGDLIMNPRAQFLKDEFEKLVQQLRPKLEQALAAGGVVIRPYPYNGHICFDWTMDWGLYPIAFDDTGMLSDVVFRDTYENGKAHYTRLERHVTNKDGSVSLSQRAFKSTNKDTIGTEVPLSDVPMWSNLAKNSKVTNAGGKLFGWFKTAHANTIDVECPMGASVYARATKLIEQADVQYSNFLWEFEASQMAVDVDPSVLRPRKGADGKMETPKLNERLFRGVDLNSDESYHVFAPQIREAAQTKGLNQLFMIIEDLVGLARGTISDSNVEAKTATELKINKQRSYATVADNQAALETCLRDVIHAMDVYATLYGLAPEGEYEVSFEWDDSIVTDSDMQVQERLMLVNSGLMGKAEFRQWYFGETKAQSEAALKTMIDENLQGVEAMLPFTGEGLAAPVKPVKATT